MMEGVCPSCGSELFDDPEPFHEGKYSYCPRCGETW
jgi:DNA-directed RNA polymerase subunit RPC12/RpoP